jgi:hypothetical protein
MTKVFTFDWRRYILRSEVSDMNLAICHVILKGFVKSFLPELENYYQGTEDRFEAVYNAASDENNEEVLEILTWIDKQGLKATFFQ